MSASQLLIGWIECRARFSYTPSAAWMVAALDLILYGPDISISRTHNARAQIYDALVYRKSRDYLSSGMIPSRERPVQERAGYSPPNYANSPIIYSPALRKDSISDLWYAPSFLWPLDSLLTDLPACGKWDFLRSTAKTPAAELMEMEGVRELCGVRNTELISSLTHASNANTVKLFSCRAVWNYRLCVFNAVCCPTLTKPRRLVIRLYIYMRVSNMLIKLTA